MSADEPEWVRAKREEDRRFNNQAKGCYLSTFVSAVLMLPISLLDQEGWGRPIAAAYLAAICGGSLWVGMCRMPRGSLGWYLSFGVAIMCGLGSAVFAAVAVA